MTDKKLEKEINTLKKNTGINLDLHDFSGTNLEFIAEQLKKINRAYMEKYDQNYFWKNVFLSRMRKTEIIEQAKSFGIPWDGRFELFIIKAKHKISATAYEILNQLFPVQLYNYIVKLEEDTAVLIHHVHDIDVHDIADCIRDTLNTEAMMYVCVSYSENSYRLEELNIAYTKVSRAMAIGKMFYYQKNIYLFEQMGTGEMIYSLDKDTCNRFLNSIKGRDELEKFDSELIHTVDCFLENNLNIAETSRQVHMHRNTLIYRIEQIQKKTGLDIRKFDDAMTFRLAGMVLKVKDMED